MHYTVAGTRRRWDRLRGPSGGRNHRGGVLIGNGHRVADRRRGIRERRSPVILTLTADSPTAWVRRPRVPSRLSVMSLPAGPGRVVDDRATTAGSPLDIPRDRYDEESGHWSLASVEYRILFIDQPSLDGADSGLATPSVLVAWPRPARIRYRPPCTSRRRPVWGCIYGPRKSRLGRHVTESPETNNIRTIAHPDRTGFCSSHRGRRQLPPREGPSASRIPRRTRVAEARPPRRRASTCPRIVVRWVGPGSSAVGLFRSLLREHRPASPHHNGPGYDGGGTYYVIAQADGASEVPETTETNNTKFSAAIKVGPDLVVTRCPLQPARQPAARSQ